MDKNHISLIMSPNLSRKHYSENLKTPNPRLRHYKNLFDKKDEVKK